MTWRDMYGNEIHIGDVVENVSKREIGRVIKTGNGLPAMMMWKRFSTKTLGYEPVGLGGAKEAYFRPMIQRHSKLWWYLHDYCIPDIEIIQYAKEKAVVKNGMLVPGNV